MNPADRKLIRSLMIVAVVLVSLMVGAMLWVTLTSPVRQPAPQPPNPGASGP